MHEEEFRYPTKSGKNQDLVLVNKTSLSSHNSSSLLGGGILAQEKFLVPRSHR